MNVRSAIPSGVNEACCVRSRIVQANVLAETASIRCVMCDTWNRALRLQKLADSYHSPMDDRVSDDRIQMLFHSFDKTAVPHVYADFKRAFLKNRMGPCLRQDLHEWEA
jgi:hypothetical protein